MYISKLYGVIGGIGKVPLWSLKFSWKNNMEMLIPARAQRHVIQTDCTAGLQNGEIYEWDEKKNR